MGKEDLKIPKIMEEKEGLNSKKRETARERKFCKMEGLGGGINFNPS